MESAQSEEGVEERTFLLFLTDAFCAFLHNLPWSGIPEGNDREMEGYSQASSRHVVDPNVGVCGCTLGQPPVVEI